MAGTRVTIADVARHAGVSKTLVSFALNDRPGVGAQARERILTAASELDWRPSQRARSLSASRAFAVGFVVARPPQMLGADPFFPSFIAGVETVLSETDRALVLLVVRDQAAEVAGYERLARDGRVDGVFLSDLRHDDPRLEHLQRLGLPAVTLNRPAGLSPFPAVCLDDRAGVRETVAHLAGLGHSRIGHASGPPAFLHSSSRRDAWAAAVAEHGLRPGPEVPGDFTPASGAEATRVLLGADDPPTAIVYANDLMAMAGLTVAHQLGIAVPGELSITGFDDSAPAAHTHPALTTVRTDTVSWGEECARVLLSLVDGGAPDDVEMPPARLVVRDTTGPPRPRGPGEDHPHRPTPVSRTPEENP